MICNWKQHFDIQRFAAAGTQTTGTSTLSAEMKTFYDKTLLDNAEPQLVHDQFGQERNIPAHGGKTIEFRKFSSLAKATTALTEGVTPDGKSLTVTSKTATVAQYGDYIVQSDMLELTAIDNTIVEATRLLGDQAGRTLDTVTREVLAGGTNVLYCPKIATDGTETAVTARASLDATCLLTVKQVFRAAAILKAANAPKINGDYVAIIHPYVAYDLMMAAGDAWMDVHKYASPENIYNGEIGKLGGVRFVETTEAKIVSNKATSPINIFCTLFLGADAYGKTKVEGSGLEVIVKQKGSSGSADPLNHCTSLDMPLDDENGGAATLGDLQEDPTAAAELDAVENALFQDQLRTVVEEALKQLSDSEADVLRRRYYQQQPLREVGEVYGMTWSRAQQVEKAAMRKLRRNPALCRFHDEVIRTMHTGAQALQHGNTAAA